MVQGVIYKVWNALWEKELKMVGKVKEKAEENA